MEFVPLDELLQVFDVDLLVALAALLPAPLLGIQLRFPLAELVLQQRYPLINPGLDFEFRFVQELLLGRVVQRFL